MISDCLGTFLGAGLIKNSIYIPVLVTCVYVEITTVRDRDGVCCSATLNVIYTVCYWQHVSISLNVLQILIASFTRKVIVFQLILVFNKLIIWIWTAVMYKWWSTLTYI